MVHTYLANKLRLVLLLNLSALAGSGMCDTGAASGDALVAIDNGKCDPENLLHGAVVATALASSSAFLQRTNGYRKTLSDGYQDLAMHGRLTTQYDAASASGNLVQTAQVDVERNSTFTLALGFGGTREQGLRMRRDRSLRRLLH